MLVTATWMLYPHMNCILVWYLPSWWNPSSNSYRHFWMASLALNTVTVPCAFPAGRADTWPSGCFRDFITFYNLIIALPFLNWTFTVIAKGVLMIVNVKHSWSLYTILCDIFGNFFLVIAGATLFSMIFLGLSFVQMYFSILYAWKPLCQFHQQQQNPVFEGSLNMCYVL